GLSYRVKTDKSLPLGLKLVDKPEGVLVQSARRDSAAAKAGISANDVIIAIDGLKATTKLVEKYAKQGGTYTVFAFRRDELLSFEVECSTSDLTEVELVIEDQAKTEKWLKA
ncbi:MAG: PDZ domain-containing protein, partial [Acinetobacter sp.]|nr:PDZ domain-containing protein [Acinetobacter sp.]